MISVFSGCLAECFQKSDSLKVWRCGTLCPHHFLNSSSNFAWLCLYPAVTSYSPADNFYPYSIPLLLFCSEHAMLRSSSQKIKSMGTEDIRFLIAEWIRSLQKFSCISCTNAYTLAGWIARKLLISCSETWISFSCFKDSQACVFPMC